MWKLPNGELRPVRCGRSNHCAYCAWLTAQENVLVVSIDAHYTRPTIGFTLTTTDEDFCMSEFRQAFAAVFKRLRRNYPERLEYLALMEWTTGKSERAKGRRFPHAHGLMKGADPDHADELHDLIRATWRELTGAWVTDCRPLRSAGGAIAYMVGHHHKREQAPPRSWSGKRFRPSQGYFFLPVGQLRGKAREMLKVQALRASTLRSLEQQGLDADTAQSVVEDIIEAYYESDGESAPGPELVQVEDDRPREVERFRRWERRKAA